MPRNLMPSQASPVPIKSQIASDLHF